MHPSIHLLPSGSFGNLSSVRPDELKPKTCQRRIMGGNSRIREGVRTNINKINSDVYCRGKEKQYVRRLHVPD